MVKYTGSSLRMLTFSLACHLQGLLCASIFFICEIGTTVVPASELF